MATILWAAALREPAASAACVLVPQAAGLERSLERRTIGACISAPATAPNGDVVQPTTTGLIVIRGLDGHAAFTDGVRTWVDGPSGLQRRMNGDRFDWETATRAVVPASGKAGGGLSLADCTEPGTRQSPDEREACAKLLGEAINATERRVSAPVLGTGKHHVLSDWRGVPVAYVDDGANAFAYDGKALFYIDRDLVFTFPGDFIGWIVDGVIRGGQGDAILMIDDSPFAPTHPPTSAEPLRAPHGAPPKRGQREIPSLLPVMTTAWTRPDHAGLPL
jgi:hypothetical protein